MSATTINHAELALSRLALRYQNAAKFRALVSQLMAISNEIEGVIIEVEKNKDIDYAEGVNLDTIGEIVGVSRIIPNSLLLHFFGFDDTIGGAGTFGEEGDPSIGLRFYEEGESTTATTTLGDVEYRLLIRAKIVKNHSHGVNEDIITALSYLFGSANTIIDDNGGMVIGVAIGRILTFQEQALVRALDIIPRPGGVRIGTLIHFDPEHYFGFEGMPGAGTFGEEGVPGTGEPFAEEF